MSKPDLGRIIAQTMAKPVEGRTIETITDEILDAKRTGGEAILTIGRCLIEAKDMLPHGEWLPWLNERVEFSERTARNFMRLAREWTNRQTLADLGAAKALTLLALPAEEREQFVEDHNVIDMSARQLKEAIRERDEARKAAEAAKADASAAEQARAKMAEDMRATQNLLESARADADSAGSRARVLEEKLRMLQEQPVEVAVETVVDPEAIEKAKAEAVAEIQTKLDKALKDKAKAKETIEALKAKLTWNEEKLNQANSNLEAQAKAEKKAALGADKDVAQFEVLFNQGQELANKMRGLLLKARGREDQTAAQGMEKAMKALAEAVGRCAE